MTMPTDRRQFWFCLSCLAGSHALMETLVYRPPASHTERDVIAVLSKLLLIVSFFAIARATVARKRHGGLSA